MRRGILVMVALGMLVVAPPGWCEPDTLFVTGDVSKSVVRIGERVGVKMKLAHPDSTARLLGPPAPVAFGPLDVVVSEPVSLGADSLGWNMEVSFFQLGEMDISAIPFALETGEGTVPVRLRPYRISIESSLHDSVEDADIRDIKGPMEVPVALRWGRVALAGGVLLALIAAVVLWRRRQTVTEIVDRYVSRIPPEDLAYLALRELEEDALPARGRIKEHYARLSLILRDYIERRFLFPAVELTTDEIRRTLLRRRPFAPRDGARILELLDEADLVKFAKFNPGVEAGKAALDGGHSWVETVAPKNEETVS
jgi:hypothetical protein